MRPAGEVELREGHKHTHLHCFEATTGGAAIALEAAEIEQALWADRSAPPQPLSSTAAALLALGRE
jgi:hypothetical protein